MEKHETHIPEHCEQKQGSQAVRSDKHRNVLIFGCVAAILVIAAAAFWYCSTLMALPLRSMSSPLG